MSRLLLSFLLFGATFALAQPAPPLNLRISDEPPGSGSQLPAPVNWTAIDEQSSTGDIIRIDIQSVPSVNGYNVEHFELGIQKPTGVTIERVLGGPATDYSRRHRGVRGSNKVWLRAVYSNEASQTMVGPGRWSEPIELTTTVGSPRVSILASKTNLLQGEGTYLEASVYGSSSLRPLHDLRYRWYVTKNDEQGSFDALPSYFGTYFNNSRTEGYGSAWGFVPRTTGDTTVNVEVRDHTGLIASNSITLNTTPLSSVFSANETFIVSTSGNFTGAPASTRTFTSLRDAVDVMSAIYRSDVKGKAWLVLRSGESFDGTYLRLIDNELTTLAITSFGDGPRPELNGFAMRLAMETSLVRGINFSGFYDPTDPMNMPSLGPNGLNVGDVEHSTIADSNFSGFGTAINPSTPGNTSIFHNILITDWGDYGMQQGDTGRFALVGSYIYQNPRAWRRRGKGESEPPFVADHGPFRTSRPTANRIVSKVVAFSTTNWTSANFIQPPFRFFGSPPPRPLRTIGSEMITEGGTFTFTVNKPTASGINPQDIIIDKFIHLTTIQPLNALSTLFGGTTIKNFIVVVPDSRTESSSGNGLRHVIAVGSSGPFEGSRDNVNNPVIFANGSIIDLRSGENTHGRTFGAFANGTVAFTDVTVSNFLIYAPDIPNGTTNTLPLELSPNWAPHYIGRFAWDEGAPDLSYATDPEATASFKPLPGSSAYKSADGEYTPVDDITGELRTGNTSKGAFH